MKQRDSVFASLFLLGVVSPAVGAEEFDAKESLRHFTPTLSDEFKGLLRNADTGAGAKFFDKKCATCHDIAQDGINNTGPLLWNVFGRKAGSKEDFEYSDAMRSSGHTWDFATLNYYLTQTERAVPGRMMNFRGIPDDKIRADLLAYLVEFNDDPPDLPE